MYPNPDPTVMSELDRMRIPVLNVRCTSGLALTPYQLFAIALTLFMYAAPMMSWCNYRSPTLSCLECFGGIVLFIVGFFDWFNGRTVLSLIDFLFSLTFFSWFHLVDMGRINVPVSTMEDSKAIFLIFLMVYFFFILVAMKDRGCFYIIGFLLYILGVIFHFVWQFSEKTWCRKLGGYLYFFSSIFIWLTGLGKGMNDIYMQQILTSIEPNL